ncbi:hypothetical protein V6N13_130533 [Hibiscus sabdariffa]|uniref:Copper transporter n=1 Tax=Hibiscus sabdariffa TaxID=183260 RepID=A0ABR2B696_9ROSI
MQRAATHLAYILGVAVGGGWQSLVAIMLGNLLGYIVDFEVMVWYFRLYSFHLRSDFDQTKCCSSNCKDFGEAS